MAHVGREVSTIILLKHMALLRGVTEVNAESDEAGPQEPATDTEEGNHGLNSGRDATG
jgi:hypothetical protein